MRFIPLFLLFVLPPAAIAINPHPAASVMVIVWTAGVIPLCLLQSIDYLRKPAPDKTSPLVEALLKLPVFILGVLSVLFGASIIAWCVYNLGVKMLPQYSGPKNLLELFLGGFGIGPTLLLFGVYLLHLVWQKRSNRGQSSFGE